MMTFPHLLRFSLRQLLREYKSGELTVLVLALIIAITSHTTIGHFSDRISRAIASNANNLIAGDLVINSHHAIDDEIVDLARQMNLKTATAQKFSSVINANDDIQLVTVKSVSENYPLKGSIKVADQLYGENVSVVHGPVQGDAWVESRILHVLDLSLGDVIGVGDTTLTISRILIQEPDRSGGYYNLTPRLMMNTADLAAANVVQPGSRVGYQMMLAAEPEQITRFKQQVKPLLRTGQTVYELGEQRPGVAKTLDKAQQYIGLASLIALLLAAVAVAGSGRYYIQRHFDTSALLRCFGTRQNDVITIFLIQLIMIAILGGFIGNILGIAIQATLLWTVNDLLPENIPGIGWSTFVSGMGLSFIVLIGFTLPSILRLKSVSPQRVLRKDLAPMPIAAWLTYGITGLLVCGMMWFYTNNIVLTISIIGGIAIVLLFSLSLIFIILKVAEKILPLLPVTIRAGARNFLRRKWSAGTQTTAFALTIMALLITILIRTELIDTWKDTIPESAPNHFVLNIQPGDAERYVNYLTKEDIRMEPLYPVVRGRLTRINDVPMVDHVSKEEQHRESLNRELNFTWSDNIPIENEITLGQWWKPQSKNAQVSVESELAQRLNIRINDQLTFTTGSLQWQAEVTSIRSVNWDNFKPNFYMIFNETTLQGLPTTWINGFYLDAGKKRSLVELVKNFPTITLIELDTVLSQIKLIINQVTLVIQVLLGFVLAAGFAVTLSELKSSMRERIKEGALLRTLGSSRKLIKSNQWGEFATMGLVAGVVALVGTEVVNALIYGRLFEIEYQPVLWIWLVAPPISALFIAVLGVRSSRPVLDHSPLISLRQGS